MSDKPLSRYTAAVAELRRMMGNCTEVTAAEVTSILLNSAQAPNLAALARGEYGTVNVGSVARALADIRDFTGRVTSRLNRSKTNVWRLADAGQDAGSFPQVQTPIDAFVSRAKTIDIRPRVYGVGGNDGIISPNADAIGAVQEALAKTGVRVARTDDDFERLINLTRKPIEFEELCDKLMMPPGLVRSLIAAAQSRGYRIDLAGSTVARKTAEPDLNDVYRIEVPPTVGETLPIGIISDTHFGSKYCLRHYLADFVAHAYERGVRHIFHAGDILDGCYKHGMFELSHHGFEDQAQDAVESLPQYPGLKYFAIGGNHDETFSAATGLDTGRALVDRFKACGRDDLVYLGARGAMVSLLGVKIELWHPKPGKSYALSYQLQNKIRDTPIGCKPDVLVAGHWHTSMFFEQRGIYALAAACWQGGGSAFGKSLGGCPSIGGVIMMLDRTEHGTLRRVQLERSAYYENERPREVA